MLTRLLIFLCGLAISVLSCPGGITNPIIRSPSSNMKSEDKRLIQISEDEPAQWLDPYQIEGLIALHANFIDITEHQDLSLARANPDTAG